MFKLDHKTIFIAISAIASSAILLTGCLASPTDDKVTSNTPSNVGNYVIKNNHAIDGGVTYQRANGVYTAYKYNQQSTKGVNFGRTPTANELKAWDTDARPDGVGLPSGSGSVEEGDDLFDDQCSACHGDFGAGGHGYPTLTGGNQEKLPNGVIKTLTNQRLKPGMPAPKRTIGTYWPKATTLFTYIRDAMPYGHPKSLTDDEVYAITAYLLAQNNIKIDGKKMEDDFVLDKAKLLKVVLPNHNGFYPDIDGPNGPENVRAFFANRAKNIGMGVRCMHDCKDPGMDGKTEATVMKIKYEMTDVVPPYSTKYDLPPEVKDKTISEAEKLYNETCKLCHSTDAMGAPMVGDIDAWSERTAKGVEKVVVNAITGVGGMPPKGGNEDLTNTQIKSIVDFMINSSKKH